MKNFIRRWLGMHPTATSPYDEPPRLVSEHSSLIPEVKHRNKFEVIDAVNGKIVVYNKFTMNPNGPDKNEMEVYLVHDGEDLMTTINTAMVSARLK